jgi:hypothetical protein
MMTRKTFQAVADAIRDARPVEPESGDWSDADDYETGREVACITVAHTLAEIFAADNPRFDRDKFLTATRKD